MNTFTPVSPKKRFGQHFLRDPNITAKIVDSLGPVARDRILEIGPGEGALTRVLLDREGRLAVLERDPDLGFMLKRQWPQLDVIIGDALRFSFARLCPGGFTKTVGNLPYNVASPLLWEFAPWAGCLEKSVFMVQKEVGERIVSRPGRKQYGSLSVWMQSFLSPKLLFTVSANVFRPKPKVHSAVLGFVSPEVGLWPGCTPGRLSRVLHICFQQRRKQIGTILKKQWGEELASILAEQGLDKKSRPEQISPQIFQKMAVFLASTQITT